jgi:hypothetical protein
MTREELEALVCIAIIDPGRYVPRRLDEKGQPYPEVREAWAARAVLAALRSPDDEPHVLTVEGEDLWSLSHPLQCRLDDLEACPVRQAAMWLEEPPAPEGLYEVTVEDDELVIGKAVTP